MIEEYLLKLGLTTNEVQIYLTLLNYGQVKAGNLIKETRLQRSVVYSGLEKLIERGLVGKHFERGVTIYTSNDPEVLVHEAEEKTFLAKKLAEELRGLRQIQDREVIVYEGDNIMKKVADRHLTSKPGSTIYFLGPSKFGVQSNLEKYWLEFHIRRFEKSIHSKLLYDKSTHPSILAKRNTFPLCEARYMPINIEIPISFIISDELVSMIVPSENPPLAFIIKSKKTSEALKKYFEYFWEQSKVFY